MSPIETLLNLMSKQTTTMANLELALNEFLKDPSFDINEPHKTGWTLLIFATYLKRKDFVQALINQPTIKINQHMNYISTAYDFLEPTQFEQLNVTLFATNKDNIRQKFQNILHTGISALYLASTDSNPELAQLLIDKGADVNLFVPYATKPTNSATTTNPKSSTSATPAKPISAPITSKTNCATASPHTNNDESAELTKALLQLRELEKIKKSIEDKKNNATREIAKNKITITSLSEQSSKIDSDILVEKQHQQKIIKVRTQKEAVMQKHIGTLQSDLDATTKNNAKIEDEVKIGTAEIERIQQAILEIEVKLVSESKKTSDLTSQIEVLTTQYKKKTLQLSKSKVENIALEEEISKANQEKTNKMKQAEELKQEIENQKLKLMEIIAAKKALQEEQQAANVILAKFSKPLPQQLIAPTTPVAHPVVYPHPIQPYPTYAHQSFISPYYSLPIAYPYQSAAHAPTTSYMPPSHDMGQTVDLDTREQFLMEQERRLERAFVQINQKPMGRPAANPQIPTQPSIQQCPPGFMMAQQAGLTLFSPEPRIPNQTGAQTLTPNQFFGTQK